VADALGVSIALMMQQGVIVAGVAALGGYAYARHADRRWDIPLRVSAAIEGQAAARAAGATGAADGPLPPLVWSVLPIVLPVILISADAAIGPSSGLPGWLVQTVRVLGDKNLALTLSAGAALALLTFSGRGAAPALPSASGLPDKSGRDGGGKPLRGDTIRRTVRDSVVEAGEIILLIAAGGALGAVLRQAGMAELAAATVPEQKLLLLPIAWGITALVRTAQGSATVAMITAVGIVGPIALAGDLPYHPVYVALAIGSGSKPGMWMNDSGFWAISRMSGLNELETLRTASAMVFIEGCVGLAATLFLAAVWPLV
jgi:GntP family gluconate:H+ symporter